VDPINLEVKAKKMNNLLKKQIFLTLFLFSSTQQILGSVAFGAQYDFQKVKEQQKKHIELMKDYQAMKEPMQFPDLPNFSGPSKFISGNCSPNQNGVTSCHMLFVTEEAPQAVLDFYKQALAANDWKIQYASIHGISARHKLGHLCNINVNESKTLKTKCRFVIDYRQIEQQH